MKWLALGVLSTATACGEAVLVARELRSDAGARGECPSEAATAELAPAVLELVIDTSSSMDEDAPGERDSKWTATRKALLATIDAMPNQTALGVVFYPDLPNEAPQCFDRDADVFIGTLGGEDSSQRRRIKDAFEAQDPEGGTPTHDAYNFAYQQVAASRATGRRFLVLVTDGNPSIAMGCRRNEPLENPLVGAAFLAQGNGVSTFVLGSPGSEEARETLSRMAAAGGTALDGCSNDGPRYCHFDMTLADDLTETMKSNLEAITRTTATCSYAVPADIGGAPFDPDQLDVAFTPRDGPTESLEQSSAGSCERGWQYSGDKSHITLCKNTCERVRDSDGRVTFQLGCSTDNP